MIVTFHAMNRKNRKILSDNYILNQTLPYEVVWPDGNWPNSISDDNKTILTWGGIGSNYLYVLRYNESTGEYEHSQSFSFIDRGGSTGNISKNGKVITVTSWGYRTIYGGGGAWDILINHIHIYRLNDSTKLYEASDLLPGTSDSIFSPENLGHYYAPIGKNILSGDGNTLCMFQRTGSPTSNSSVPTVFSIWRYIDSSWTKSFELSIGTVSTGANGIALSYDGNMAFISIAFTSIQHVYKYNTGTSSWSLIWTNNDIFVYYSAFSDNGNYLTINPINTTTIKRYKYNGSTYVLDTNGTITVSTLPLPQGTNYVSLTVQNYGISVSNDSYRVICHIIKTAQDEESLIVYQTQTAYVLTYHNKNWVQSSNSYQRDGRVTGSPDGTMFIIDKELYKLQN